MTDANASRLRFVCVACITSCSRLCHLLATVENGIVASKPQGFGPSAAYNPIVTGFVSMRCRMLRVDEDAFTMISGLIVIAVVCITGLLALGI